jgi:hypothetical protein
MSDKKVVEYTVAKVRFVQICTLSHARSATFYVKSHATWPGQHLHFAGVCLIT